MIPIHKEQAWLSMCLISAAMLGGCDEKFVETSTNQYLGYKEAVSDGAVTRGWLPENLPSGARGIVETHNIDTNELWVKFILDNAGFEDFVQACAAARDLRWPSQRRLKRMAAWWPEMLTEEEAWRMRSEIRTYRCAGMPHANLKLDIGIAFDPKAATVWYWKER